MSARTPRKRAQWRRLLSFDSFQEAKTALLGFDDEGAVKSPAWASLPGGDAHRRTYQCIAHQNCKVLLRVAQHSSGEWELRREASAVHSLLLNDKDRKNAALAREQKEMMKLAREFGGTPATVLAKLQFTAVKNGAARKHNEGPGEKSVLQGVQCSVLACVQPTIPCVCATNYTFTPLT